MKRAFEELAATHQSTRMPSAGPPNGRWSDVPLAVLYACDEAEVAIVRTKKHDWGFEYELKTVEDWPGRLTVRRRRDEKMYEASATIGRFGDHSDRAEQLLAALDRQVRAFGRKRRLE